MLDYAEEKLVMLEFCEEKDKLTVIRFKPFIFAPRHKPVDIAPHPEYRSNNVTSGFVWSITSHPLASTSLEIVEEVSLPALLFSAS